MASVAFRSTLVVAAVKHSVSWVNFGVRVALADGTSLNDVIAVSGVHLYM